MIYFELIFKDSNLQFSHIFQFFHFIFYFHINSKVITCLNLTPGHRSTKDDEIKVTVGKVRLCVKCLQKICMRQYFFGESLSADLC